MSLRSNRRLAALTTMAATFLAACGTTSPSAAAVPPSFYGVVPETQLSQGDYSRMAADRVGSIRFQMYWPRIEPFAPILGIHSYQWSATDDVITAAVTNGIQPLPILFGTPTYLTGCSTADRTCQVELPLKSAAQTEAWTQFVSAAVERYGPTPPLTSPNYFKSFWVLHPTVPYRPIETWQIWNEQNAPKLLASPKSYTKLLSLAHAAISADDPAAKVMLGGMFGTPHGSRARANTSWGFLSGLYKAGARPFFDSVALHPYSPTVNGIAYQIKRIRKVMDAHGDRSASIYVTELGWGSDRRHTKGQELVKTPGQQKQLLSKSFSMLRDHRASWGIGGVYWFSWQDPPPGKGLCGFCYSTGLYASDGTPKPAVDAFRKFTAAAKRP